MRAHEDEGKGMGIGEEGEGSSYGSIGMGNRFICSFCIYFIFYIYRGDTIGREGIRTHEDTGEKVEIGDEGEGAGAS